MIENKSTQRCFLTTAKDVATNLGTALNGNNRVATHQCRVATCRHTFTGTKYVALYIRFITTIRSSYDYLRIIFHSTNLTTTIDRTIHLSVGTADANIRCKRHGFFTPPCVGITLTTTEHITRARSR